MDFSQVIVSVVVALVAAAGEAMRRYFSRQQKGSLASSLFGFARQAVEAAEFLSAKYDDLTGADKYQFALESLRAFAKRVGIKVTDEEGMVIIHAVLAEAQKVWEYDKPFVGEAHPVFASWAPEDDEHMQAAREQMRQNEHVANVVQLPAPEA